MGQGAFAGKAVTETAEHGGADDSKAPNFQNLVPQQIQVPTGLTGMSCTWGAKVYGDQQEIVYKNRTTAIVLNDDLHVGVDKSDTVEAKHDIVVKGGRTSTITPTEVLAVLGNRNVWVHGQDTEHYLVHREIHEPVERIEHSEKAVEYGDSIAETFGSSFEAKGFAVEVKGLQAELELFKSANSAIENQLKPLQNKISALETAIGALKLAAKVKLNALVNWALSSPTS